MCSVKTKVNFILRLFSFNTARISREEVRNIDDGELATVVEWVVPGVSGHPSNFLLLWMETEGRQCCCHILFFFNSYFSASSRMTDGQSERLCINPTTSESAEGRNGDRVFFFELERSRTKCRWRVTSRSSLITPFHRRQ